MADGLRQTGSRLRYTVQRVRRQHVRERAVELNAALNSAGRVDPSQHGR